MGKLRDQMLVDLQLSGAKPSAQRTYLREAENLAKYFHKSPEQLGEDELKAYLLYLMKERHLSEGTFRFYVAVLKFLYRTTLKREWAVQKIRYPRAKRKLPVVLDLSETGKRASRLILKPCWIVRGVACHPLVQPGLCFPE
jgi:integrase/recombinase XerD